MNLIDLVGKNENNPAYKELERTNGIRHYNFLDSIISTSLTIEHYSISEDLIKAINFHAIACLHKGAGEYRVGQVTITESDHVPPPADDVPQLMEEFIRDVNNAWNATDTIALASYVMWRINHTHPFVNGNGRTARAMFYYVFCLKLKVKIGIQLPELIRTKYRGAYVKAHQEVDKTSKDTLDISPLAKLMKKIIITAIRPKSKSG